jgi:integrase
MGRTGDGVEIRERSIRLSFTLHGKPERHTLMVNGAPMAPTPANIKYAHRLAAEIRERIRNDTFSLAEYFPASGAGSGSTLTVGGWLDTWLGTQNVATSTRNGYESAVKFWKAVTTDKKAPRPMGTMSVRALKLSHILTAIASRPELTGKTVNNYVSVLRQALDLAVADRVLPANPAEDVPRQKHQKPPPDPFTMEEAERIIADMREHYPEPIYNMTEAWFFSGPRTGEVFGLRWINVELKQKRFTVAESIVAGEHKDSTKTDVAREVMMNSRALAAFTRQAKHTRMTGEHVWIDPRYGTAWEDERAYRRSYWTPTLKRLGIRYRRPYNMRHTYATMMLMAGMTPAFCARQLGHSVEMFLRTYSKWLDGQRNDLEMSRLEASFSSPESPRAKENAP